MRYMLFLLLSLLGALNPSVWAEEAGSTRSYDALASIFDGPFPASREMVPIGGVPVIPVSELKMRKTQPPPEIGPAPMTPGSSSRPCPLPSARYRGLDLRITEPERAFLEEGDLRRFWISRLGKDPVARIGLVLWGTSEDLAQALARFPASYWTPEMNPLSYLALRQRMPADAVLPPRTRQDLEYYWSWMGKTTKERVESALRTRYALPDSAAARAQIAKLTKAIGKALARAHAAAVDADVAQDQGEVPGLLSQAQIMEYHHQVFTSFGLPAETYGGTPYSWLPDPVELLVSGDLYGHDCDPVEQ